MFLRHVTFNLKHSLFSVLVTAIKNLKKCSFWLGGFEIFLICRVKQANFTAHYIAAKSKKLGLKCLMIMRRVNTVTLIQNDSP